MNFTTLFFLFFLEEDSSILNSFMGNYTDRQVVKFENIKVLHWKLQGEGGFIHILLLNVIK